MPKLPEDVVKAVGDAVCGKPGEYFVLLYATSEGTGVDSNVPPETLPTFLEETAGRLRKGELRNAQ